MNMIYDNHANDIEFFDINKKRKRDNRDLKEMSLEELNSKKIEIDELYSGLIDLYSSIPTEKTKNRIEKLLTYKTALKIERAKRKKVENIKNNDENLSKSIARLKKLREVDRNASDKMKEKLKEVLTKEEFKSFISSLNEKTPH